MAEINFLCVHKKLRTKKLTPVLIKEITRRVNLTSTWQAVYTAGVVIPKPISSTNYYHRNINTKKLVEVGFSALPSGTPMARYVKMNKLPRMEDIHLIGTVRPMEMKDVNKVHTLLQVYLKKFRVKFNFTKKEITHQMLPRENVMHSFVIEDSKKKDVTDFFSFYYLPSTVLSKTSGHSKINVAYLFYNVVTVNSLEEMMKLALVKAKELDIDVFNALNIMDNTQFLDNLKFGQGDGFLHYYLYNWKLKEGVKPEEIGAILV
mmetsp:Transcript_25131/g.24590  ORF Transcript_25131/g.24590 Transcript_25131/m.24590 type:complete len:262 (-) Transcript_25131:41-826(-)